MTHAFIADGRLYIRDHRGSVKEIESSFIRDKVERADRSKTYAGWKGQSSPEDMYFGAPVVWGRQSAPAMVANFRFQHVLLAGENRLYYTLTNNVVTGLFEYDLAEQFETRLFHKNDIIEHGFDYSPVRKEFVMAVQDAEGRVGLDLLNEKGSDLKELTSGDSRDSNPSFSLKNPNHILFQSSGIARDEAGYAILYGAEAIYRLDLEKEEMEEVLCDERFDFLLPREDREGNLYCIRRPYQQSSRFSPLKTILDIVLFPFRFVVALIGFLEAFTRLFNQQGFKVDGPRVQAPRQDKYVQVLGQTIQIAKIRRQSRFGREPSLVPGNWELIRVSPDGRMEILARNAASYDIDAQGKVHYTNGYCVRTLVQEAREVLFRYKMIEHLKTVQ